MAKSLLALAILLLWLCSCNKSDSVVTPASVTVVHAIFNGKPVIPVFSYDAIQFYSGAPKLNYGASALYNSRGGIQPFYLAKSTDTTKRIYNSEMELEAGGLYSLFFAGDTTQPESVLVQDNIPVHDDSTAGVRFINLSPASSPIKVNIKGFPAKAEFSDLGYKQITDFKAFTANSNIIGNRYIFEIRNQSNDSLLLTYTWSYTRFRNNTLVFSGGVNAGKPASLRIFSVKNY